MLAGKPSLQAAVQRELDAINKALAELARAQMLNAASDMRHQDGWAEIHHGGDHDHHARPHQHQHQHAAAASVLPALRAALSEHGAKVHHSSGGGGSSGGNASAAAPATVR
jgi:hypothetical protein